MEWLLPTDQLPPMDQHPHITLLTQVFCRCLAETQQHPCFSGTSCLLRPVQKRHRLYSRAGVVRPEDAAVLPALIPSSITHLMPVP